MKENRAIQVAQALRLVVSRGEDRRAHRAVLGVAGEQARQEKAEAVKDLGTESGCKAQTKEMSSDGKLSMNRSAGCVAWSLTTVENSSEEGKLSSPLISSFTCKNREVQF